jgi:ABC-type bacteriocin/lantibiotic exporter with double-glycine peptidase domain
MAANQLSPTERFWRLLKPDKKEIQNVYVYSIFYGLVNLSLPLGIQAIVNLIQAGQISTSWVVLVTFVVLGVALIGVLQIFQLRITENLQQRIFTRAAFEFSYRIPRTKMSELIKHYFPELANRFFDTLTLQKGVSKVLIDFSAASIQIIFGLILLSLYHPFFIVFSFILIALLLAIFKLTSKRGLETSLKESKYKYKVAHWLQEIARTSITFKLAGNTQLHYSKTDKNVEGYLNARESHFKVLLQQYAMLVFFKVVITASLLIVGGWLVMDQHMNIGQFVAAEIIIIMIMNAVEKLILNLETIYDVLTSIEKIGQVTDMEMENISGSDITKISSQEKGISIQMADVSYQYSDENHYTIKNLNLEIEPCSTNLLTGKNASGKSTLLHIMAALLDVEEGNISFNNFPVGNIDLHSLRTITGNCFTQDQVFEGTIEENISLGREDVTINDVIWAIQSVGLTDFMKSLPKGYNTNLKPLGNKLPSNILYKLLLARSIVHKPKLLLIEDVFGKFTPEDRNDILKFLTSKSNGWTLVLAASDAQYAPYFDNVLYLVDGKIEPLK